MHNILTQPIEWFRQFGDTLDTDHGPLTFQDNGANVLAVAHLDAVGFSKPKQRGHRVWCPQLDDRLGAWVLLDLLPRLGVVVDVLLTDSEERGESTASYFDPPKDYRWVFQFDRAGTDVVLYEYETDERIALLKDYGFRVGWGTFSDIGSLNHLGVTGFNFGVGYHAQHTAHCWADLRQTRRQVERFVPFWQALKDTTLPWVKPEEVESTTVPYWVSALREKRDRVRRSAHWWDWPDESEEERSHSEWVYDEGWGLWRPKWELAH